MLEIFSEAQLFAPDFSNPYTPGPRLMGVHLVQNSTSAKFEKSPNIHLVRPSIHLVRPIIHLVRIFALSD